MSDYISRGAFIADCEGRYCAPCKEQGKDANGVRCRACWVDDMLSEVLDAPAADVEPVRHGRWGKKQGGFWEFAACSLCGEKTPTVGIIPNFCPNCGAKMDLENETNEN